MASSTDNQTNRPPKQFRADIKTSLCSSKIVRDVGNQESFPLDQATWTLICDKIDGSVALWILATNMFLLALALASIAMFIVYFAFAMRNMTFLWVSIGLTVADYLVSFALGHALAKLVERKVEALAKDMLTSTPTVEVEADTESSGVLGWLLSTGDRYFITVTTAAAGNI